MGERDTKQLIKQLISTKPNPREISQSVDLFNRIAIAYLKQKISRGQFNLNRIQLQLEDFASDCIAGLFERDEQGRFVQLQTYFEQYDLDGMSDHELFSLCRRLVFSKVNDGIFRNFRTIDPALGKIIRNLKLAIQKHPQITLENKQDMNRIVFGEQSNSEKPLMPVEILRIRLTQRIEAKMFISDSLETIYEIMHEQNLYRKQYPLVEMAKILRYAYTQLHDNAEDNQQPEQPDNSLHKKNVYSFIQNSINRVRKDMHDTYVKKDKLDQKTFDIYFECIEDILSDLFVEKGKTSSYFDHLQHYLDDISRSAYREKHRGYLEYLVKKARTDLVHKLRKEF